MIERIRELWKRRAVRLGLELLIVVGVFFGVSAWQTRGALAGKAPALALAALDGGSVDSAALLGKPTVLVFWAPWCGVCAAESGNVSRLHEWVGDHANVVSVASEYRGVDEVRAYVAKHGVDYPVLLGGTKTARAFHVRAFPTAYFLDANGEINHVVTGYTTLPGMALRLFL